MSNTAPTQTSPSHRCRPSIAIAALSCAVAIAACGSSGSSGTSTSAGNQGVAFSQCMRSHGVSNFPDPTPGGGGIQINSAINPASPAFQAAQSRCGKLLPGGGPGGRGPASAQAKAQMLAISRCMRAHGVTGFPDPTTTPPANPSGYSQVMGQGGVFLAVPDTIDADSPVYRQAATACQFGVPPGAKKTPSS